MIKGKMIKRKRKKRLKHLLFLKEYTEKLKEEKLI